MSKIPLPPLQDRVEAFAAELLQKCGEDTSAVAMSCLQMLDTSGGYLIARNKHKTVVLDALKRHEISHNSRGSLERLQLSFDKTTSELLRHALRPLVK